MLVATTNNTPGRLPFVVFRGGRRRVVGAGVTRPRAASLTYTSHEVGFCTDLDRRARSHAQTRPSLALRPALVLQGNSWDICLNQTNTRLLVDPWLVGSLTFGGLNAIYEGKKKVFGRNEPVDLDAMARATDAILLTMSIDDHCHRPTLQALVERRPDVPVVASPSAAALARSLGFTNVTSLDWAEEKEVDVGNVTVRATAGALVGPPWSKREAGFVVREKDGGASLYYEPHCDFDANSVRQVGTVDVVVSPPNTQSLLGYDLVKGNTDNVALLSLLKPKTVIALMNAEFIGTGPLADLITERGGPEALKEQIRAAQDVDSDIEVVVPKSGEPLTLTV